MSGASMPVPFNFRSRRECVDWRQINAIDVDRVASELNFQILQDHIAGVTFCNLEGERCLNCQSHVDPALLKLFRLAQLTIEYLLHSQDCLALRLQAAEEQFQTEATEKQHLQLHLQKQIQYNKSLKEELKHRKRIIASQQVMISAGLANYNKCEYCEKAFMNASFLKSHIQRRHPIEHDKLITDNQEDLQTIKLQEEIIKLQEQLTLAKSEMEILQKDYKTKQEMDLKQKQADFMKQLEFWKENEQVHMNSKIDEVKQACQRDMETLHQKNKKLVKQMLMLQQSSKTQENMQPVQGQASFVQNGEEEQNHVVAELQQKLYNQTSESGDWHNGKLAARFIKFRRQAGRISNTKLWKEQPYQHDLTSTILKTVVDKEIRWTEERQKIKEEYESERNQLQTALAQMNSTAPKENKRVERKVKELELRLEEQQKTITLQNMQINSFTTKSPKSTIQEAPEPKTRVVVSEHPSLVCKLDPIVEISEEDKESSSFSEGHSDSKSMQQKVNELLKNPSLKRDLHLAVHRSLDDKLLHLGIDPAVGGISRSTYESTMARVVSERQQRQKEYAEYRKIHKYLHQNLDKLVKERQTQPIIKPSQPVQMLPQSRPRYSSFPAKQQYTLQPANQNNTATYPITSTQMAPHKTSDLSLVEASSEEENGKAPLRSCFQGIQQYTACPAQASFQKAAQCSGTHRTPVFSINKMKVTVPENESEWTEGSEMEEISLDQLQKHTDQNGNVTETFCSYVKALSDNLEHQLVDQAHKNTASVAIPEKRDGITNTHDAVWEIKNTGFEDDNDDDWDISSLEDVPVAHTSSFAPVRKSMDKSIDTSTSVWGTMTGIGQEPTIHRWTYWCVLDRCPAAEPKFASA
ncbi:cilium assembly protein DZIP1 isoform X2 [Tachysurus fulvidraco]|uniref:cilium assembly protein DZIP1 isoform X2 n=1 Tax=Tachysurus fulvidraco TaxID=1234273 RepID=UPI001FEEADA7|nr:cilium assembly protein DZIP1 isoform X2 [Tachysurus fulvidraco]